ncbi:hypothetical protein [Cylindrospermum stagnale]|uniref:hypothetical protein n=1 Tax=Cylindrospermum stagnale TaxID=142864 RepID=UPI00059CBA5E|nr:hypothetical protein [Cylindrospermum stagnale]
MLIGKTSWIEQDRNNRDPGRRKAEDNFNSLPMQEKEALFDLLHWPKSNIKIASQLLNRLKNRSHRYQNLTRREFANRERAVTIIATEYNLGGTNTIEDKAGTSQYGLDVWRLMQASSIIKNFFPNE